MTEIARVLTDQFGVSSAEIDKARRFQTEYGGRLESVLVNMGVLSDDDVTQALSVTLEIGQVTADEVFSTQFSVPAREDIDGLNVEYLLDRKWLPLGRTADDAWDMAAVDPLDLEVNQYLQTSGIGYSVRICADALFRELSHRVRAEWVESDDFSDVALSDSEVDRLREMASEAPTVALVNSLITKGIRQGASDLHLEPHNEMYRVRLRIDGVLHDVEYLPSKVQLPVASRLKILAGMDIAEKRRPQDGKISLKIASTDLDIRVSTTPLVEGESVVLRFLPKESSRFDLAGLGIAADTLALINEDLQRTSGVILLTGPTGSGKTTTLYSFLNRLNDEDVKIITLEDPVEYRLSGINQIQVHPEIGYDFAKGLRSVVRQDPDIIMVGEIRDGETARIAIQSALTGHLVFSTVHTNNAPSTYSRLMDLGVEEFLLNASLVSIIAQRLVRRLCSDCAEPDPDAEAQIRRYELDTLAESSGVSPPRVMRAKGCDRCAQSGYRGRVAVIEYLRCDQALTELPKDARLVPAVYQVMASEGRRSLRADGLLKVAEGVTTIDEIIREIG